MVQRVTRAAVVVSEQTVGAIDRGLLVLLGVGPDDGLEQVRWMANKLVGLRIFSDAEGLMNLSVGEVGGSALVVSQFTLYGDCRKGRRPSFVKAARPELAEPLYEAFCEALQQQGIPTARGVFGADMAVSLVNDGPVTLVIDSP